MSIRDVSKRSRNPPDCTAFLQTSLCRFELLRREQREFDHSLNQLIGTADDETFDHQIFDVQSNEVMELQSAPTRPNGDLLR